MFIIDNDLQVKKFCTLLNNLNQVAKIINKEEYNFNKGLIVCNNDNFLSSYNTIIPKFKETKNEKTNQLDIKKYFDNSCFTIKGNEFFQFFKNYKKNINKITITDDYIEFGTDIKLLNLKFNLNKNISFKPFTRKFDSKLIKNDNYEKFISFNINSNILQKIIDYGNLPFVFIFDFDKKQVYFSNDNIKPNSFFQLRFNKKFILGLKNIKKDTLTITFYKIKNNKNLYLLVFKVETDKFKIYQYFLTVDVL